MQCCLFSINLSSIGIVAVQEWLILKNLPLIDYIMMKNWVRFIYYGSIIWFSKNFLFELWKAGLKSFKSSILWVWNFITRKVITISKIQIIMSNIYCLNKITSVMVANMTFFISMTFAYLTWYAVSWKRSALYHWIVISSKKLTVT